MGRNLQELRRTAVFSAISAASVSAATISADTIYGDIRGEAASVSPSELSATANRRHDYVPIHILLAASVSAVPIMYASQAGTLKEAYVCSNTSGTYITGAASGYVFDISNDRGVAGLASGKTVIAKATTGNVTILKAGPYSLGTVVATSGALVAGETLYLNVDKSAPATGLPYFGVQLVWEPS